MSTPFSYFLTRGLMIVIYLQDNMSGNTKVGKSFELQNVGPVDDDKPNRKAL